MAPEGNGIQRDKQAGRALVRILGDRGEILFPDRGRASLKVFIRKHGDRPRDGYGSHHNGKHKLG